MIRLMSSLCAASALAMSPAVFAAQIEIESEGPVIELSISESVTAEPDIATVFAGVTSEAPTAVEAMRLNAAEMRKVIDRIKAQGVDEEDIQTSGINLSARYDYNQETRRQEFRGYQVSNRVSVILRNVSATGQVLDALVSAGATDISGPSFSIEDDKAAKATAREYAVKRGEERAKAYAAMLGYNDVRVLEINETIRNSGVQQEGIMARAMAMSDSTPVQPGRVSTGVSITIKYEMISDEATE